MHRPREPDVLRSTTTTTTRTMATRTVRIEPKPLHYSPSAELAENHRFVRLQLDLPGVMASDVEVDMTHNVLTVQGVRKIFSVDGSVCTKKYKFSCRYAIDTTVIDVPAIRATLAHGVLTVRAPKKKKEFVQQPTSDVFKIGVKTTQALPQQANATTESPPTAPCPTEPSTKPSNDESPPNHSDKKDSDSK